MAETTTPPAKYLPIIYVRGYAGTQADVEATVDDPLYGFNAGSTHIRLDENGRADFFMFVSPFARLFKDHGYRDVIDGAYQQAPAPHPNTQWTRTIWIFRYYDVTSKTFDTSKEPQRLSIEAAAGQLKELIERVELETGAPRVHLVAHSMGGPVCRCLIQKLYPEAGVDPATHVAKLFTYGTPHGGIAFDLGGGVIEKIRDALRINNADDFGPKRMYQYLTPGAKPGDEPPQSFDSRTMNVGKILDTESEFTSDRVFCVVGSNAADYDVAWGASRFSVGPQSDGLVQIRNAYVYGSNRAYIHRSHSGRYGMVNSEEGYQNLQRFLFGDVRVKAILCKFKLDFKAAEGAEFKPDEGDQLTYQFETQISVRGMPVLMHDRSLAHYSAESLNETQYQQQMERGGLPLFTNFLIQQFGQEKKMRYMIRVAVFRQLFRKGILPFKDHIERLPLWSDYIIVELRPPGQEERDQGWLFAAFYSWASSGLEHGLDSARHRPAVPRVRRAVDDEGAIGAGYRRAGHVPDVRLAMRCQPRRRAARADDELRTNKTAGSRR